LTAAKRETIPRQDVTVGAKNRHLEPQIRAWQPLFEALAVGTPGLTLLVSAIAENAILPRALYWLSGMESGLREIV
jgi:hypothetical protein